MGGKQRIERLDGRVEDDEAALCGEEFADAPTVLFERAVENHTELSAEFACDLRERSAVRGDL